VKNEKDVLVTDSNRILVIGGGSVLSAIECTSAWAEPLRLRWLLKS